MTVERRLEPSMERREYSRGEGYNNGYANKESNMYATQAAAVP